MRKGKRFSLVAYSLRRKLNIAFALMSILPLLITGYLVSNYILPRVGLQLDIIATIVISVFIALAGFFVIKEIFDRILSVTAEAKLIASGDINRTLKGEYGDEVGVLGESLNHLTQRIRLNMDELKNYSAKTTEINLEIQKRVIVLSSLLQISSLITQSSKLEDVLKLTVEKSRLLANSEAAYLLFREEGQEHFSMRVADGANSEHLQGITVGTKEGLFHLFVDPYKPLVIDGQSSLSEKLCDAFREKFKLKNSLAIPIHIRGKVIAILGVGNTKEAFQYKKEDTELVDVFAKQVAIAVENDMLMHKVDKLEIKDSLTGSYNEAFIRNRLQEEIKRAITYQRPCAFILLDIDNFKRFIEHSGSLQSETALKKIAVLIKDSVAEIDRVGRTGDDEFAVILPERNKRQGQEIAEDIRKKIEFAFSEEKDINRRITVSGGVSENPLDGISAQELMGTAKELLDCAKRQGKNRIAVFKEA